MANIPVTEQDVCDQLNSSCAVQQQGSVFAGAVHTHAIAQLMKIIKCYVIA